jgi:hypothetical protein
MNTFITGSAVFILGAFSEATGFFWVRWTHNGLSTRVFFLTLIQAAGVASGAYLYVNAPFSIGFYAMGAAIGAWLPTKLYGPARAEKS